MFQLSSSGLSRNMCREKQPDTPSVVSSQNNCSFTLFEKIFKFIDILIFQSDIKIFILILFCNK